MRKKSFAPVAGRAPRVMILGSLPGQSAQVAVDLVAMCEMYFDDEAALDAAMASDEMRVAGRNLREIAPGLLTLVALEESGS